MMHDATATYFAKRAGLRRRDGRKPSTFLGSRDILIRSPLTWHHAFDAMMEHWPLIAGERCTVHIVGESKPRWTFHRDDLRKNIRRPIVAARTLAFFLGELSIVSDIVGRGQLHYRELKDVKVDRT